MNKEDMIESLMKVLSTRKEASMAVNKLFKSMNEALRNGEKVVVSGFCSFSRPILTCRKIGTVPIFA